MLVFNIQHFSTHDGPGIRTVIFLKGCPLNCAWCHNPDGQGFASEISFDSARCIDCGMCTVCPNEAHTFDGRHIFDRSKCTVCKKCAEVCPTGALEVIGKEYSVAEIMREVSKDALFYGKDGGVTISGGEPFAQYDALIELLKALKSAGYNTAVETSGYTSVKRLREAAEYTDLFLYDCKLTDDEKSLAYTGPSFEELSAGLAVLDEFGAKAVLRCPIIPDINDDFDHISAIAVLAERHSSIISVELEPYHPLGLRKYAIVGKTAAYNNEKKLSAETLSRLLDRLGKLMSKPAFTGAE